jgi:putative transposase
MTATHRKRCQRYDEPGHAHELTFTCFRGLPLLTRERTCRWLVEAIEEARSRLQFDLWAYVFMPEHVHLLIRPREANYRISRILWWIKRPVGHKAIAFLEETAPQWLENLTVHHADGSKERRFWQVGGGYDRNVVEPETASQMVDYVHLNPVRRGLVSRPDEWEWSSARWYAGIRPVRLEIGPELPDPSRG